MWLMRYVTIATNTAHTALTFTSADNIFLCVCADADRIET